MEYQDFLKELAEAVLNGRSDKELNAILNKYSSDVWNNKQLMQNSLDQSGVKNVVVSDDLLERSKEGLDIEISFSANAQNQQALRDNNVDFKNIADDKISAKAKLVTQEGFNVEDNEENRKKLLDNGITFIEHPTEKGKLFIPAKAQKVGSLLIMSAVMGPVPALLTQIILNQTGVLDKLMHMNMINKDQKNSLNAGETIRAKQNVNGKQVEQFLFMDKHTGQINRINVNDFHITKNQFRGVEISPENKQRLMNGNAVYLNSPDGLDIALKIDATAEDGIREYYKDTQNQKYYQFPRMNSSDEDLLRYVTIRGSQGIDEVFRGKGSENLRNEFLQRHDLTESYNSIANLQREVEKITNKKAVSTDNKNEHSNILLQAEDRSLLEKIAMSDDALSTIKTHYKGKDTDEVVSILERIGIANEFGDAFKSAMDADLTNFRRSHAPDIEGETYPFTPQQEKIEIEKLEDISEKYNENLKEAATSILNQDQGQNQSKNIDLDNFNRKQRDQQNNTMSSGEEEQEESLITLMNELSQQQGNFKERGKELMMKYYTKGMSSKTTM